LPSGLRNVTFIGSLEEDTEDVVESGESVNFRLTPAIVGVLTGVEEGVVGMEGLLGVINAGAVEPWSTNTNLGCKF